MTFYTFKKNSGCSLQAEIVIMRNNIIVFEMAKDAFTDINRYFTIHDKNDFMVKQICNWLKIFDYKGPSIFDNVKVPKHFTTWLYFERITALSNICLM